MEAEATPFIEHLQLQKIDDYFPSHLPFLAYRGLYPDNNSRNTQVTVITNGKDAVYGTDACNVGTIAASTITMLALQKEEIPYYDVFINAGTAGGFARHGAAIGDVYLVTAFTFHDRRIPIPGYDTYGMGQTGSTLNVAALLEHYNNNDIHWKSGICTTGDSLDKTAECDAIMEQSQATVKDMEAAAIAWVVALHNNGKAQNVKFTSLKVVTDIVDGNQPTHEEFLANLQTASEQLQRALPLLLDYIASKDVSEL